ncbi:MAG: hypothetical protein V1823_03700 [Chloroflexota bacterium]
MEGFGSSIKYLYQNFILRDVLSFITPGAIIVLTAFYLFLYPWISSHYPQILFIHWLLYIPIFGLFFVVGFAVQCFGEIIGLVRFWPPTPALTGWNVFWNKLQIFGRNWGQRTQNRWLFEECLRQRTQNRWLFDERLRLEHLSDRAEATEHDENAQQSLERLVVLQQMCVNNFLAISIALVFLAWYSCSWTPIKLILLVIIGLVAFFLLVSLFWGYRVHTLRLYVRDEIIKRRRREPIQTIPGFRTYRRG